MAVSNVDLTEFDEGSLEVKHRRRISEALFYRGRKSTRLVENCPIWYRDGDHGLPGRYVKRQGSDVLLRDHAGDPVLIPRRDVRRRVFMDNRAFVVWTDDKAASTNSS